MGRTYRSGGTTDKQKIGAQGLRWKVGDKRGKGGTLRVGGDQGGEKMEVCCDGGRVVEVEERKESVEERKESVEERKKVWRKGRKCGGNDEYVEERNSVWRKGRVCGGKEESVEERKGVWRKGREC
ncbi:hypothetical protein Pmani_021840 [Petrolisthes manimaculis]|uniref:Uncharacterized protein n=1 Tax=Petrolisthes manimaculis TaxID=1843537 RepID=A0AAE1PF05_9EUCA|nr:hypothetical protein Pmani_021840 [Petrolisthes manimaculis]